MSEPAIIWVQCSHVRRYTCELSLRPFSRYFCFLLPVAAQTLELSKSVKQFVRVDASKVALPHVRVIDGTGAAPVEDQNVIIEDGKILAIERGAEVATAAGKTLVDLRGYT
jgi:hypothetical protein